MFICMNFLHFQCDLLELLKVLAYVTGSEVLNTIAQFNVADCGHIAGYFVLLDINDPCRDIFMLLCCMCCCNYLMFNYIC